MDNIITRSGKQFFSRIIYYLHYLCEDNSIYQTEIKIPGDILYRTELMCNYISKSSGEDFNFGLDSFIKIIYLNFLKECVEKYKPEKVYKMLITDYFNVKNIIISNGTDECVIKRNSRDIYTINIELPCDDVEAGELILREIYELFKYKFSFKTLIEQLWLNFIDSYKTGKDKNAMQHLKKMMEEYLAQNYSD